MSDDNVVSMANKYRDGTLQSPKQALEDAIKDIGVRGAFKNGKKLLIIALDDDDQYSISFVQAGMTMSECNNLCDIAKTIFKTEMGYI